MSARKHAVHIAEMERDGTMDRCRAELRAWFASHPKNTPQQAVRALGYTFGDHIYAVADSVRWDLLHGKNTVDASVVVERG